MARIVCGPCQVTMKCHKEGVYVVEHDGRGLPYKLWSADEYRCPGCGSMAIASFGSEPIAESYQGGFKATLAKAELHPALIRHEYPRLLQASNAKAEAHHVGS